MGDNANPDLTHEQQQATDTSRIEGQFVATDAIERATAMLEKIGFGNGSGPGGFFGKTDFEGARLNAMLDLLETADPAELENAGDALQRARTALNKAADELDAFVKATEWKGESGNEFRRYGGELARYAGDLGTFANAVGTQMKVASEGLASVRNARPPRDNRADPKKPEAFPPSERKEDNAEYKAALKAEKDRQEAINQMNRLASFYAVSQESLAGQEPPRMPGALTTAVPRPYGAWEDDRASTATSSRGERSPSSAQEAVAPPTRIADAGGTPQSDVAGLLTALAPATPSPVQPSPPVPGPDTSMVIDSVTAPPAPPTAPVTPTAPVAPAPGAPTPGPVPPMAPGMSSPVQNKAVQAQGGPGVSRAGGPSSASAQGRGAIGAGGVPAAKYAESAGRSGVIGGAPGAAGGGSAAGRAGAVGPMGGGAPAAGRAGAVGPSGQSPMAGRAGSGSSAGSPAGRAGGIVGGTPQRATGAASGPRIPRGTVIGAEGAAPGRSAPPRTGQSGVIGAGPANGVSQPTGRGTPSTKGIVGTPSNGGTGSRPVAGGFTTGGSGLVGGRPGHRQPDGEERESSGSARPDYLTEDEETWAVRRRAVPPVIE
ncbi:hypothetical protein [Streptomyces jumonjinensis]|uniref:hypothetical protein n=1 Tax=Streptomyces jumonjinensis TaxID=1945 RepID=UPI0037B7F13F